MIVANRNICGVIRSNPHTIYNDCSITSSFVSYTSDHISYSSLFNYHIRRSFGTKIKVYNQPDVGEGTVEVDILEWLVKPGDQVKALQTIGRGKYEKADVDILAPTYDGTVHRLLVEAGSVAIVGKPLVEFQVDDTGSPSSSSSSSIENNDDTTTNIDSSTM